MAKYWEIEEGTINSSNLFTALLHSFPEATTFFAEGTHIAKDVITCYTAHIQPGKYLPAKGTLYPEPRQFRCEFSPEFIQQLSQLSEHHAETELLDHLFLHKNDTPLLAWYDAFANPIWISSLVSEKSVSGLATQLGLPYREISIGQ